MVNARIRDLYGWNAAEVIEWVSPVASDDYAEYFDEAFLARLGLEVRVPLRDFWPQSGPRWDGLARTSSGKVILVEAKAYIEEAVDFSSQASPESLERIRRALQQAKEAFAADPRAPWETPFYQYANRLAHLHYLAGMNSLDAYLLFVNFAGAPDVDQACSAAEWHGASRVLHKALGIPKGHRYEVRIRHLVVPVGDLLSVR